MSSDPRQQPSLEALESVFLQIIQIGRDRCGSGFGKYPLGVRDALRELEPLVDSKKVRERLADFDERLAR